MGSGGLLKRTTVLWLLHSACNLSQQFRRHEWYAIWELVNHKGCKQLVAPVLSRWECVGEACEHVIQNYNEWKVLVSHVIAAEKSDTTRYTIATHLYSLLRETMITHIQFLLAL